MYIYIYIYIYILSSYYPVREAGEVCSFANRVIDWTIGMSECLR